MEELNELRVIGRACYEFRRMKGYTQNDVACDLGYCLQNVSNFECGKNGNIHILLWYIKKGMNIMEVVHGK